MRLVDWHDWSSAEQKRGADGVKIAVLRKGRADLMLIMAAAHAQCYNLNVI